jgi:hypothetical protein
MATYKEVKNILKDNNLSEDEFKRMFNIVLKTNWKLQKIMESVKIKNSLWENPH